MTRAIVRFIGVLLLVGWTMTQGAIIRVKPTGNDSSDGSTWDLAKKTVSGALSASASGDEVWVAAGSYGLITLVSGVGVYGGFAGTESSRDQRDWVANVCRLSGSGDGTPTVTIPSGTATSTRIDGFTITGVSNTSGGAIKCVGASPTITNNVVTGSIAFGGGAGISCTNSSAIITHNVITQNNFNGGSGAGGGIYLSGSGSPVIQYNTIVGNSATTGGGILCTGPKALIANNVIRGNTVQGTSSAGGGISVKSPGVTIRDNVITGNTSGGPAGAIQASAACVIACNVISGNGGASGGAIDASVANVTIFNNTIVDNQSVTGGAVRFSVGTSTCSNNIIVGNAAGISVIGTKAPILSHNDVYGNASFNYAGISDPTGTNGNISVDPMCAMLGYGDLHIQPGSPCVDAGDDSVVDSSWTDMDGQARVQGAHVDIGADESDGTTWPDQPAVIHVSPSGADSNDGLTWGTAKLTIQSALDAAAGSRGEVWVAAGTYVESVSLPEFGRLYGGFAGTETQRDQRDWRANVCTIQNPGSSGNVSVGPGGNFFSVFDGFSLTSNTTIGSSGISCQFSSAVIANNTIVCRGTGQNSGLASGIHCVSASATITNNAITGGWGGAAGNGGGICVELGNATITGNSISGCLGSTSGGGIYASGAVTITDNAITNNTSLIGGGIYCTGPAQVNRNVIRGNTAAGGYETPMQGGGIWCSSSLSLLNNDIRGNAAEQAGGGIWLSGSAVSVLADNVVANNWSLQGAGLFLSQCSASIINNTIEGNIGSDGGVRFELCSPTFANNIVAANGAGFVLGGTGSPVFRSNDVFGNTAYDYSGVADPTGTNGNIAVEPMLAAPIVGDLHIQPTSPCRDAGDNAFVPAGWTDMDGQPRVLPSGGTVDIGADESDGTVWPSTGMVMHVAPGGNDANDGLSWLTAKRTVQSGVATVGGGGQVWVAAGTYLEHIVLPAGVLLYGGFNGTESFLDQRDWTKNETILDGSKTYIVVATRGGAMRVDGFTIRNGHAANNGGMSPEGGGGIDSRYSVPTIAHNSFIGNDVPIECDYAAPTISNNAFSGNTGAVLCNACTATVLNNTLSGNGYSYGYGYGIDCSNGGSAVISGNAVSDAGSISAYFNSTLTNNQCIGAGGITAATGSVVANNLLVGCTRGISCSGTCTIANNTLVANVGPYSGIGASDSAVVANNLVAFNECGISIAKSATPSIRNNDVFANVDFNYKGVADPTGTAGNISQDPRLAGALLGREHIQPGSPCVDAGDDSVVQPGWTDMDGQARLQGTHVDIGADESDGTLWDSAPHVVRVKPGGDDAKDGSTWDLAKRTVQAAIDAAADTGGEVWVQEGTYTGCLFARRYVHLYGGFVGTEQSRDQRDLSTHKSIFDGAFAGSVVTFDIGQGTNTLDGFTVQNGQADKGGGLSATNSGPTITNNTITGNQPAVGTNGRQGTGCGIYATGGAALIASNNVTGNGILTDANTMGGGVYCDGGARLSANVVEGNRATYGGGVAATGNAVVEANRISGNTAHYGGGIGMIAPSQGVRQAVTVRRNLIENNSGSGIFIYVYSDYDYSTILNNTIVGCVATDAAALYANEFRGIVASNVMCYNANDDRLATGSTGAIVNITGDSTRVPGFVNNTVSGNRSTKSYAVLALGTVSVANNVIAFNTGGLWSGTATASYLSNNDVFGNSGSNYSGIADQTGTNGNISADPIFASVPFADYHIQPSSPCLNAGNDAMVDVSWTDIDGQPRIIGPHVDMGADESDGTLWQVTPRIVRVSTTGDDRNDGATWATAKRTVQAASDAASDPGGEVWVRSGTYNENVQLGRAVSLYGGFAGTETARDQRDWSANVTVLDGGGNGSVVTAAIGGAGVVDGFTIQNGKAPQGGGICSAYASIDVRNNHIRANTANDTNYGYGGGLWLEGSAAHVEGNTIEDNVATATWMAKGGGIAVYGGGPVIVGNTVQHNYVAGAPMSIGGGVSAVTSNMQLLSNTISSNSAPDTGGVSASGGSYTVAGNVISGNTGAGISCSGSAPAVVSSNSVFRNSATNGGGIYCSGTVAVTGNVVLDNTAVRGGGVYATSFAGLLASNEILNNIATSQGGGVYFETGRSSKIVNSTVAGNYAIDGGGIYSKDGLETIANNIVAGNSTGVSLATVGSTFVFASNCVYGNDALDFSGFTTNPIGTNGNIAADPKLADVVRGNAHIQRDSACVNAGDNSYVDTSWLDVDGQTRVQGGRVDIGADESDGSTWWVAPATVIHISTAGSDGDDGLTWSAAKRTVAAGLAATQPGDEVWVASGVYDESITLKRGVGLYGGFAGNERWRDQRVLDPSTPSVLNGNGAQGQRVVAAETGCLRTTVLDGFSIQNGAATSGAGITCVTAGPTISRCVIKSNVASGDGGGVALSSSTGILFGDTIVGNQASGLGGGITCSNSPASIVSCVISHNTSAKGGGGVDCQNSFPVLDSNLISGNSGATGGGVYTSKAVPRMTNNTVAQNVGTGNSVGGVWIYAAPQSPLFANNIVYGNSPGGVKRDSGQKLTCWGNDLFGNTILDFNPVNENPTGSNGNISQDPLFAAIGKGDYHLLAGSPCIDSGADAYAGQVDADLQPRFVGPHVDMGAYELISVTASGRLIFGHLAGAAPSSVTFQLRPHGSTVPLSAFSAVLASDGSFTVPVPAAVFDLSVKPGTWLRKTTPLDTTSGSVSGVEIEITNGDVSGDNRVGFADLSLVLSAFMSSNPSADVNRDGSVGIADLSVVLLNFNLTGDP